MLVVGFAGKIINGVVVIVVGGGGSGAVVAAVAEAVEVVVSKG